MDPFANLGIKSSSKQGSGQSLQERQQQQLAERARLAKEKQPANDADAAFWDSFGNSKPSGGTGSIKPVAVQRTAQEDEDDLLAGFNASAPVDASSHFPPPKPKVASSRTSSQIPSKAPQPPTQLSFNGDDDDDPFGLSEFKSKTGPRSTVSHAPAQAAEDDDDFLGLLGKPVSELPQRQAQVRPREDAVNGHGRKSGHPADKAVAELVDMGFPPDKARDALAHTESGVDVQAAVGWLLNQAHAETGSRKQSQEPSREASRGRSSRTESPANGQPAWFRGSGATSRQDGESPASRERDPAKVAAEIGSKFYKTAGSFWKTAQKTAQKAMADFQQEGGDTNQPKWMREAQAQNETEARQAKRAEEDKPTDEAMMLDVPAPERPQRKGQSGHSTPQNGPGTNASMLEVNGSALRSSSTSPAQALPVRPRPSEKITRQLVEEQSAQAYVSANRRRKPPPADVKQASPAETKAQQPKEPGFASADAMDDFFAAPAPSAAPPAQASAAGSKRSTGTSTPTTVRPAAKARAVPHTDVAVLAASHTHRQKGTEAFKRGDYASAHSHYTAALSPLPAAHPILVVIHCNRALTSLKTGDPKAAISDAEAALAIIGPSRGEGEAISLASSGAADEAGDKPLKDFFSKALMRKAEAFEHMEKWPAAAQAWREAVEAGVGGAVAIQGRNRCEKAASPARAASASAPTAAMPRARPTPAAKKAPPASRTSALADLGGSAAPESEAVQRLRAANLAAAAASDEQFALTDSVDARLDAWKGSKKDNLRALLASLDTVLWADAGWTKVGMSDLVMPNRVKIVYMKAIAKVHPDKLSQTATTEQKMISAAVFATLNEAWDKFKTDNGL